jgi:hypothetical protein
MGDILDLWRAWHEEGVDVITKKEDHSMKWCASLTAVEVKWYNWSCFVTDHIVAKLDENMDQVRVTLQKMDGEKGGAKKSQ